MRISSDFVFVKCSWLLTHRIQSLICIHPRTCLYVRVGNFYRAMHYSAKSGIAIACRSSVRLSVHLSVALVDCDRLEILETNYKLHGQLAQHLRSS